MQTIYVASVLLFDGQRMLIQKRKPDDTHPGEWENPGGKVEEGELFVSAALRELAEELGKLEIKIESAPRFSITLPDKDRKLAIQFFVAELISGKPEPLAAAELRWVTAAEFRKIRPLSRGIETIMDLVTPLFKKR